MELGKHRRPAGKPYATDLNRSTQQRSSLARPREPCRLDERNHIERSMVDRSIREKRCDARFVDDQAREKLLFIGSVDGEDSNGEGSG